MLPYNTTLITATLIKRIYIIYFLVTTLLAGIKLFHSETGLGIGGQGSGELHAAYPPDDGYHTTKRERHYQIERTF